MSRFSDAIYISDGACNPVAVAHTINHHMSIMHQNGSSSTEIREDPALRLMVHQLAFLMNVQQLDSEVCAWSHLRHKCEVQSSNEMKHER